MTIGPVLDLLASVITKIGEILKKNNFKLNYTRLPG